MFCQKCGKEVEDTARFCDGCGNNLQENTSAVKNKVLKDIVDNGKTVVKGFFSKNPESIIDIAKSNNSKIGLILIIVNIILFGLVSCFNITQIYNDFIGGLFSSLEDAAQNLLGSILSSQLPTADNFTMPIFIELSFPLALISLIIFGIMVCTIYLILKVRKLPLVSISTMLNRVGISSCPMIVALIINFILGFIIPSLTPYIFVLGILSTIIFYYENTKDFFKKDYPVLEISAVFLIIIFVIAIAINIGINQLENSLIEMIANEAGSEVSSILGDIF